MLTHDDQEGNETDSAIAPDSSVEGDTSNAQNNDALADDSSPKTADTKEASAEVLREQLKNKARNERQLGSIAANAVKPLLKQALSGDKESIEALQAPEMKGYIKKKHSEEYGQLFQEEKNIARDLAVDAKAELTAMQRNDSIKAAITKRGIKGEKDFNDILKTAKTLKNFSVDNAVGAAIRAVKGDSTSSQPYMGNTVAVTPSMNTKDDFTPKGHEIAKGFGITEADIEKYNKPDTIKYMPKGSYDSQEFDSFNKI